MREVVLGTAGHVDHGKTSLIKALTGIDTDRLKEEKERGITIELGFAYIDLPSGRRLGIVDVPGHERFVKNMVAGAAGIDLVAFIIAADEGIMPQTREHFEICSLLGVKRGLVVITKKDLVEPDWLNLVEEDVKEFLAGSFLEHAPMLAVSSTTGEGIEAVRDVLDTLVSESEFVESHGPFRLPIDRIFSMKGFGAVVTGTSISGKIAVGDDAVIFPSQVTTKIRGIQVHGEAVQEVEAGRRTAINLQGVEKETIARGDVLASPDCLRPTYMLDAEFVYLSGNKKPLKNRCRVRVHLGTAEILGRIVLLDDEELPTGACANIQLLLEKPVGVWPGDHYVVRGYSPIYTIGGGVILNNNAKKRRRFKKTNKEIFELYRHGALEDQALLHVEESGLAGITFTDLAVKTGIFGKKLKKILEPPISARRILIIDSEKQRMIAARAFTKLLAAAKDILEGFHKDNPLKPGLPKEELRSRLARGLDQRLFQYMLNELVKNGSIVQDESIIRLSGHRVSLKDDAKIIRQELVASYSEAGLTPPNTNDILSRFGDYPKSLVREVLAVLVREKVLIKITEDLYFHAEAIDGLREKLIAFLKDEGEIDAPRFKSLTGLTRKFSIPLLEYFDKLKLTIRVGDKRVLREQRG